MSLYANLQAIKRAIDLPCLDVVKNKKSIIKPTLKCYIDVVIKQLKIGVEAEYPQQKLLSSKLTELRQEVKNFSSVDKIRNVMQEIKLISASKEFKKELFLIQNASVVANYMCSELAIEQLSPLAQEQRVTYFDQSHGFTAKYPWER